MATRLKRYEGQGLALKVPTLNFTSNTVRTNSFSNLSSRLDKMSEMFYNKAVQTAKIEGAEYGARNAPTLQQLKDASQSNTELDLVGDKDTVFGRYARTATLEATSDKLTVIAKQNMAQIILDAKANDTNPSEVQRQLDSVIIGLSDVLDTESPITAKKFKATTSIFANSEFKSYTSTYITNKQKEQQTQWVINFSDVLTNDLPKLIENGMPKRIKGSIGDQENIATTFETIQEIKEGLLSTRPIGMSSEQVLSYIKMFDDKILDTAKDVVEQTVFENNDPQKIINALDNNKLDKLPMAIQSAFSVVGGENKGLLKSILYKAIDDRNKREVADINLRDKRRKLKVEEIEINSANALLITDATNRYNKYNEAIIEMQKIDPKKAIEMRELLKENPELQYAPFSDSTTFNSISMKFNDREVTIKQYQLNNLLLTGKLSKADFNDFTEKLTARSDEDFNRALSYARSKLNLPKSFINIGGQENKNIKYLKNIEEAMYKERAFNPDFLPMQWVEDNFDTYVANGKNVERQRIKQLAGDHFNLETLNKKINRTPRRINDKPNPYYQQLINEKNEIINWNNNNPDDKVTF